MKVINKALLAEFRNAPRCEFCKRLNSGGLHPHHVRTKGAGRVDVKENLVALCPFDHRRHHDGNEPTTVQLLELVSRREGKSVASIRRKIDRIRADTRVKTWIVK